MSSPNQPPLDSSKPTTANHPPTADITHFQCGDPSHSAFRRNPDLEATVRRQCGLPKLQRQTTNDKGQVVQQIVHRSVVTQMMVEEFHKRSKKKWVERGNEYKPRQKTAKEDKAVADRKELEADDWEVIDEADVDDSMDVRGEFSHQRVKIVDDGLQ